MKKWIAVVLVLVPVLGLVACNGTETRGQAEEPIVLQDDFSNSISVEINDNIIQNCISYAKNLGYDAGKTKKAVLLGEDWIASVYCDDDMKQGLIDAKDIVVIFDSIRCVVDADTEIVLGRIPFV